MRLEQYEAGDYSGESRIIVEMENNKVAMGHVTLVGLGGLGIRKELNLTQVNRGGPEKITAIDSQRISEGDLIFRILGW